MVHAKMTIFGFEGLVVSSLEVFCGLGVGLHIDKREFYYMLIFFSKKGKRFNIIQKYISFSLNFICMRKKTLRIIFWINHLWAEKNFKKKFLSFSFLSELFSNKKSLFCKAQFLFFFQSERKIWDSIFCDFFNFCMES